MAALEAPEPLRMSLGGAIRLTWDCLDRRTQRLLVASGIAAGVLALLDAIGISLLPALLGRLQGKEGGTLSSLSTASLACLIGALLLVKTVAGAGLVFWQSHFLAVDEADRTISLFRNLVLRPFGEVDTDTGDLVRDLHFAVPMLYRAAGGLAMLGVDGLTIVALAVVVAIQSPVAGLTLSVAVVMVGWAYMGLVRERIVTLGEQLQGQNADVLRQITEGFASLKTVKAFGCEPMSIRRFGDVRRRFAGPTRDYSFYLQFSRYYLEAALVLVIGACVVVVYLVEGQAEVVAVVGLLGGVAARAMPALTRVLHGTTTLRVSGPIVAELAPQIAAIDEDDSTDGVSDVPATDASLRLEHVTFRHRGMDRDVLDGISLDVRVGEVVAVVGGSGRGKSTMVDLMIGLLKPTAGVVGRPGSRVGYVAQETFIWDDGARFNVAMDRPQAGDDASGDIWEALAKARLDEWVRTLPTQLDEPLGERGSRMSGGQRQRLGIARALYGRPAFLVLDEPTSALDAPTSRAILDTLAGLKENMGIVIVTHDPIVLEYSDRFVDLDDPERSTA